MWVYSPKKNKAKKNPGYSILNPDTNSDSPSVRSKGARFVSAIMDTKKIKAIGSKGIKKNINIFWILIISNILNVPDNKQTFIKIKPKDTS